MALLEKAKTVKDIRRVCKPVPLKGETLDAYFVETDLARDPHQNTRKKILEVLEADEIVRMLFYGHRGCGKSTELNKFLSEHGDGFFPVTFSVLDEMTPPAACAEDLVLVITQNVLRTAQLEGLKVSDELLKPVEDFFAETVAETCQARDAEMKAGAGVGVSTGFLAKLVDTFAKFSAEIRFNAHSKETSVAALRKRPGDLVAQANNVIGAVQAALPDDKPLLVIVEDLDKLGLAQATDIYVNHVNLLTGIRTRIIYTIPVFLMHSPDANVFKPLFDAVIPLPMIKVMEPTGESESGMNTVRAVVDQRLEKGSIEEDALTLLVRKTGGVLRHVFEVLQTVSLINNVVTPFKEEQITYGLNQLKKEFWHTTTLPYKRVPDGPKSVDELYDRLADYGRKQQKGKVIQPVSDPINQILLKSLALVEYNGDGWLGVHPLVMENLKDLGRI